MFDLSSLDARSRRICKEALRRTDFPFGLVPAEVRVEVVGIQSRGGGQMHHPRGPLQVAPATMQSVENAIQCFAHESGHATDFILLTEEQRTEIRKLLGAPADAPWPDHTEQTPYYDRVYEAFAEAFSHAYFDLVSTPDRYRYRTTPEVTRAIRRLLTPNLPEEKSSELTGASLVKLVAKWKDQNGSYTDVLVRPTTQRRLDFYCRNDLPLKKTVARYKRRNATIKVVTA